MKGFKKLLILFLISALIIGVGAVSAADDLGASEDVINTEVSGDLNAIDDSNPADVISVNEENDEIEEIQSGDSASLNENTNVLKANGNTITVQGNTFQDIQDAIDSANEGDTISLSGTYYGSGDAITVDYDHQVSIIGNGKTVLDAKGLSRILTVECSNVIIKNLNFINGNDTYAAAVYWSSSYGRIDNCNFTNNNANSSIIYVSESSDSGIYNCSFENNTVNNYERPQQLIEVTDEVFDFSLTNSSFIHNSAFGFCWWGSRGCITDCIFMDNAGLYRSYDEYDYLSDVYMDNGVYDFSMKIYDDVVLGNPKYYYGEDYYDEEKPNWLIYLEHYGSKKGNLVVYINGTEAYNEEMNHRNTLSVDSLQIVKYGFVNLAVKFVSDDSDLVLYNDTVFIDYDFGINGFYNEESLIYYGTDSFDILLPEDATGVLTLYDGIQTYNIQYANGMATYKLKAYNYKIGNHTFSVTLINDPKYPEKTISRSFYVIPKITVPYNFAIGEDEFIIFDSPEDFDGIITVYNGTEEQVEIDYGDWTDYDYIIIKDQEIARITDAKGVVKLPINDLPLNLGSNILIFKISGEGNYEEPCYLYVFENDPRFSSSIDSSNIELGDNVIVRANTPKANGELEIYVDNNFYKALSLDKTSFVETVSGLGVGEHKIKVLAYEIYYGDEGENSEIIFSSTFYVNVTEEGQSTPEPLNATIELDYLDENVVIKLKDLDGNPLSGKKVSVYANNAESNLTTDSNGEAIVPITESSTIKVVYTDANGFNVSSSLVVKVVEKIVIEHEEVPVSANATISLIPDGDSVKIVLKDLNGNALSKFVDVTVNGINYPNRPTNAAGETTVSVSGNYSIAVVYTDVNGASVSASLINVLTPVTPTLAATSISASDITTVAKTNKNLVLTLKDVDGTILANKNVTVSINGKTTTVTTNSNGQATIKTNFASSGTYYYSLCYLGDDNHKASFKTVKVTVNKQATKAVFKAKTFKVKATKKISFTLKDASGKVIAKKKITFKVNGNTYTVTTNSKGVATVTIKITKKGKYTATAKFAGDSAYKAISKKATITIK